MSTYATLSQVRKVYTSSLSDDDLKKLIDTAEREINMALGNWSLDLETGLKLDPTRLAGFRSISLYRAVAFQCEYHEVKGEAFFIEFRAQTTSGRDFNLQGQEPYIAPKASQELANARLYRLTAGAPYPYGLLGSLPNQNFDDFVYP